MLQAFDKQKACLPRPPSPGIYLRIYLQGNYSEWWARKLAQDYSLAVLFIITKTLETTYVHNKRGLVKQTLEQA